MYAKVFSSLWNGTLAEPYSRWATFVFMLANCDPDGNIDMTREVISKRSGVPLEEVREAIEHLEAPDIQSRSPEEDGRRILRIDEHRDWGWHIVNHKFYTELQDSDMVRSQTRERVARHREMKRLVTVGNGCVTDGNGSKRHTDTDTDTDTDTENQTLSGEPDVGLVGLSPNRDPDRVKNLQDWQDGFRQFWEAYPSRTNSSKKQALKVWMGFCPKDYSTADDLFTSMMGALEDSSKEWRGREPDKIPHHVVWLRRELWRNDAQ
jgi:hypothetical protein